MGKRLLRVCRTAVGLLFASLIDFYKLWGVHCMSSRYTTKNFRRQALALAVAASLGFAGTTVHAQSTSGAVYGNADAGAQVELLNLGSGQSRTTTAGADGKFSVSSLQPGDYRVTATEKGQSNTRTITVVAGQGFNLNLVGAAVAAAGAENLGTVSVTANALPPIDVASVQTSTAITAEQMKSLPIARNVTAIALLTPGAVRGDAAFGNLASFGGASVAENSYYVNGFNVTNQFDSLSFSQVPYEAIDQTTVQDGGYGAAYGNSTGGVISVQTKRGTNEWLGGVDYTLDPISAMAKEPQIYLKNGTLAYVSSSNNNYQIGNNGVNAPIDFSNRWNAWIGGPLIKDKLFFFGLFSQTRTNDAGYNPVQDQGAGGYVSNREKDPYWLVKLDWNINDTNILELTSFNDTRHIASDVFYSSFDAQGNPSHNDYQGVYQQKYGGQSDILKYTSYITDDLTLTSQYGKNKNNRDTTAVAANGTVETYSGNINTQASGCPQITDARNPVLDGTIAPYNHCSFVPGGFLSTPDGEDTRSSFRLDLDYKIGDHDITGGWSRDRTTSITGQGYEGGSLYYYYGDPGAYNVQQVIFNTGAKVGMTQRAEYLEDNWHITDNFLARIGVRNDQFNNQNGTAQTYVRQDNNIQPRLGFSWDVHGDSTLKVYGSAGDYSLPIDAGVALRGAAASIYSFQTFSYTGVDPVTGAPQGLTPQGPIGYANGAAGVAPNAASYSPADLKPFKQREFILGAQQQVSDWTLGVKAVYRHVLDGLDDLCDFRPIAAYADRVYGMNIDPTSLAPPGDNPNLNGCFIGNPGSGAQLMLPLDPNNPSKLYAVNLSGKDIGEPKYKRNYYALDLTAERNFDNVYYLNVSYTFARSYGNSEGLVDSNIGQADTGTSELFDYPELMTGANGNQTNDHRHTLKAYGAWKITPEWQLGANFYIQTGRPENCYGDAPIDAVIGGYGTGGASPYLYCIINGVGSYVSRGSAGTTPTVWNLDLNGAYKPDWAKGLTLRATLFNVFNKHAITTVNEAQNANQGATLFTTNTYLTPTGFQTPRYLQLNAEYDFSL
jgi:Carboxypeptidase regulatory-like domain/TonB-dependent Receptor Plug Domain